MHEGVCHEAGETSRSSGSAVPLREEPERILIELALLFDRLRPKLLRMVQARISPRLRGRMDAEEVVQGAFLRLMRDVRTRPPESEGQLRAWLYKKVWSQLQDELRKWNTSRRDMGREDPLPPEESIADLVQRIGLSTHLGLKDVVELIRRALRPIEFEIIWLRIVDELSYGEIAEIFDLAEDTVRKRHVRALLKVRKTVSDPFASSTGSAPD